MKFESSRWLLFCLISVLVIAIVDAVYFKETGRSIVNFPHPIVGFPFTEKFYFHKRSATAFYESYNTQVDIEKIIKGRFPIFINRMYWVLFSRFYILPQSIFSAASQNVCQILDQNEKTRSIEFFAVENDGTEFKRRYDCRP